MQCSACGDSTSKNVDVWKCSCNNYVKRVFYQEYKIHSDLSNISVAPDILGSYKHGVYYVMTIKGYEYTYDELMLNLMEKVQRDDAQRVMRHFKAERADESEERTEERRVDPVERGFVPHRLDSPIKLIISKMHQLGIIHGDLHSANIVVSADMDDVRIIDFGYSTYIKSLDDEYIPKYLKESSWFLGKDFSSLDELLRYEFTMYKDWYQYP